MWLDRAIRTAYVLPRTVSHWVPIVRCATRVVVGVLVGSVSFGAPPSGQPNPPAVDSDTVMIPRGHVGVAADIGRPVGDFKQNLGNVVGRQAHVPLRLDRYGLAALRLPGGWLTYGHESQRSCLGTTPGRRVAVHVTTANGICSLGVGPQCAFPLGPLRTYRYGLVGVGRFATLNEPGGGLVPDIAAADDKYGDAGLVWTGGRPDGQSSRLARV